MAQTTFKTWERFEFGDHMDHRSSGYGLVLPDGNAMIFTGVGGRTGWKLCRGKMPENAKPLSIPPTHLHHEPKIAFDAIEVAMTGVPKL